MAAAVNRPGAAAAMTEGGTRPGADEPDPPVSGDGERRLRRTGNNQIDSLSVTRLAGPDGSPRQTLAPERLTRERYARLVV